MTNKRLRLAGLAGVAAIALTASACGSSSSGKSAVPASAGGTSSTTSASPAPAGQVGAVLTAAYHKAISANSAAVVLHATVDSTQTSATVSGTGAFNWVQKDGTMNVATSVLGHQIDVTAVYTDGAIYEHLPSDLQSQTGGKPWVKVDVSGLTSGSSGQDPAQILSVLAAQSSGVTKAGTEAVDGVTTTHYKATVDPSKLAANAGPEAQKFLAELGSGLAPFPMDVWIDGSGRPVRMIFKETITKGPANLPAAAQAAFPVTTSVQMDLSDWGKTVDVTVPPASQVSSINLPGLTAGS